MTISRSAILASAAAALVSGIITTAEAQDSGYMMQACRIRAHEVIHTRLPDIETKYEGQRTDGTHAVNGTAWLRGRQETFQCSFNRSGRQIIQFIVNQPSEGSGAATQLPETEPVTREQRVRFRGNPSQDFSGRLNPGDSIRYVFGGGNRKFLHVNMQTRNHRTYFNIFTPEGKTLYESARAGNDYRGQLWLDGRHIVEVYNASRRPADYNLWLELRK